MPAISAIEPGRRPKRFNIYIDGAFAAAAGEGVVAALKLSVGQEIDSARLVEITHTEELRRALEAAARLLEIRARSTKEIESRLLQRGFDPSLVQETLSALSQAGLADDSEFAREWVASRNRSRPRGRRALRSELTQKGLERDRIDAIVESISDGDELEMARKALVPKIGRAGIATDHDARMAQYKRLGAFLQRRGFGWETVKAVLAEHFGRIQDEP